MNQQASLSHQDNVIQDSIVTEDLMRRDHLTKGNSSHYQHQGRLDSLGMELDCDFYFIHLFLLIIILFFSIFCFFFSNCFFIAII